MEPITTAWMVTTLLSGWLGNRADYLLCKGANRLYSRIKSNLNEPVNHHIQRAVRKSYLQATLMAVDHLQKQRSRFTLTDRSWQNLDEIKDFIKEQIDHTYKVDGYIRSSVLDNEHRDILFAKGGEASDRMLELIQNLKDSIINELEGGRRRVETALKKCINEGWKEGSREMDFYRLTCAFFTQELKTNPELSTFIQTEYLDNILSDVGEVSIQISQLSESLFSIFEEYKEILPKLDEILAGITKLEEGQKEILAVVPEKTANLVLQGIKDRIITSRQINVSEDYQKYINELEEIKTSLESLKNKRDGFKKVMAQADDTSKSFLEQNILDLESQLLQKASEKETKENEFNAFVSNVIQLAQQLKQTAALDSDRLQKARALFEEGRYQELNEVLNEKDIERDIAQYEEKGKVLANELTIKAQTTVLTKHKGWFDEANRLYAKAIGVIENYETTFNYAYFLADHKQILEAADMYEKALKYISDEYQKAKILNNLGLLQRQKNEFEKAERSYEEALAIDRKLAEANPQTCLLSVGMTLCNLGALHRDKIEFEKAERSVEEALAIFRKLAESNPQTYLPYLGGTLNSLGVLQCDKKELEKAERFFEEALAIKRKLAEVDPQTYLPDVGMTLNNLGTLQCDKNEFEKAERSLEEVSAIYRKLAEVNAHTYLPSVGMALYNLGTLRCDKNEFEKADRSFEEALLIYRKLADVHPQTYLPAVGTTLNSLGTLQRYKKEFEKAERFFEEALAIRRKLAEVNPQVYSISYADTAINLAILYVLSIIDREKSIHYTNEAIIWYGPFRDSIPHAKRRVKTAEDILEYWNK